MAKAKAKSDLTAEEKARSVMCRTGQPGNYVAAFTDAELDELAGVYEESLSDETTLAPLVSQFWARRQLRLEALKATDYIQPAEAGAE